MPDLAATPGPEPPLTVWRVTRPAAEVLVAAVNEEQAKALADDEFYRDDWGDETYEAVDTGERPWLRGRRPERRFTPPRLARGHSRRACDPTRRPYGGPGAVTPKLGTDPRSV
jgi:hypothetical protein